MIQRNNLCAFPFYDSTSEQHHRKPYAFGAVYPLIMSNELVPFQFARSSQDVNQNAVINFTGQRSIYPAVAPNKPIDGVVINDGLVSFLALKGLSQSDSMIYTPNPQELFGASTLQMYSGSTLRVSVPNECVITKIYFDGESANLTSGDGTILNGNYEPDTNVASHTFNVVGGPISIKRIAVDFVGPAQITTCEVKNLEGTVIIRNATSLLYNAGLNTFSDRGLDYIILPSSVKGLNLKPGQYYIDMSADSIGENYVSEVFTVVDDVNMYVRLEWRDNEDLQLDGQPNYLYSASDFSNVLYIDTFIGKPKYDFDEEGKDRDGYFFASKQISKKTYNFVFLAPEFLCDALRLARLSDYVSITDKDSSRPYVCDSILMEPNWEDQGDLASVEVEFTSGTVIKKIATGWPR